MFYIRTTHVKKHPLGTNEVSDGARLPGAPRPAADSFCRHRLGRLSLLGISWVGWRRPKAPRGQQRRGYSDRTSGRSHHLVVVLVWFGRQRGMKNWACDGFDFFLGPVGVLLCATRAAAAPAALPLVIDGSRL